MKTSDDYQSIMRSMVNNAHGIEYKAVENFDKAKVTKDACVIFEADWGGQIYLTCPMKYVHCTEEELKYLIIYIESIQWNQGDGYGIFYEVLSIGHGVAGGMGGGIIIDGLWIHDEISEPEVRNYIYDIICKERTL